MVWIPLAVGCACWPVRPFGEWSCDALNWSVWETFKLPLHGLPPQGLFPGLKVLLVGRLVQDLSGWAGVHDLCSSSLPFLPQVTLQIPVSLQLPNTNGSERNQVSLRFIEQWARVTCAIYCSTRLLRYLTQSFCPFGCDIQKCLVLCLNLWIPTVVWTAGPIRPTTVYLRFDWQEPL